MCFRRPHRHPRRTTAHRTAAAAIAAAAALSPALARAQSTRYYVGNGSPWTSPSSWSDSPNGPPGAPTPAPGDTASLSSSSNLTVPFDGNYASPGLAALYLDSSGPAATLTFSQSSPATTLYSAAEYLGAAGSAAVVQSAGTHVVSGPIRLGNAAGSSGAYSLSAAGSLSAGSIFDGYDGAGSFTHTGGTNSSTFLYLGYDPGSSGSYSLSGDAALSSSRQYVGYAGTGTFTQTGGSNRADLYLGYTGSATGVYLLSGGSLDTNIEQVIAGSFVQTGGSHTVSTLLLSSGLPASYSLSAGSLAVSYEILGPGTFAQSGGTHTATYRFELGPGTYSLSGSALLSVATNEMLGTSSFPSSFVQTGGTHSVKGNLYLAYATGTGTYTLSGDSTLAATGTVVVGSGGTGSFVHSAGSASVGAVMIGQNTGSSGTYSLSGSGSLSAVNQYVGNGGAGTFLQTGGTNSVSGELHVDGRNGLTGFYSLSAGSLSANSLSVAFSGAGSFAQSGGTNTIATSLNIGTTASTAGAYSLSAGSLTAHAASVGGYTTVGRLSISGGNATVPSTLSVSSWVGCSLSLSGGSLTVGTLAADYAPVSVSGGTLAATSITGASLTLSAPDPSSPSRVSLAPAASPTTASRLNSLSITHADGGSALLDITNNPLVLDYSPYGSSPVDAIRSYLLTARTASGNWDGASGITSSAAAADPTHTTAIAYAEAAQLLNLSANHTAPWSGRTVDATSLLLKPTPYGDANLDGIVDADDYALLDRSLAVARTNALWTDGDFNYDGQITSADYLLIDSTYLANHTPSPSFLTMRESQFGPDYVSALLASIPEPNSLAACGLALHLGRRRRR